MVYKLHGLVPLLLVRPLTKMSAYQRGSLIWGTVIPPVVGKSFYIPEESRPLGKDIPGFLGIISKETP